MGTRRRVGRLLAVLFTFALVAAACDYTNWEEGGIYRQWYCDPTDIEVNDGHGGGAHGGHHFPYTEEKGPLSGEHCFNIIFQLTVASNYAALFPNKAVAESNGWHWLAPWIPGQGTHHVNEANGVTSSFNPLTPTMLMFDGNGASAPLTGMVWTVQSGHAPPAGFSGDNDHWHAHEKLCYINSARSFAGQWVTPPFIIGDNISDAACTSANGTNVDSSDTWLLHAWLPVYDGWYATDIFNKEHPGI